MHAPHFWKLRRRQGHSPRRCRPVWEGFTKSQRHMTSYDCNEGWKTQWMGKTSILINPGTAQANSSQNLDLHRVARCLTIFGHEETRIMMIGWQWHRLSSGPGCWSQQNPTWAAKILQPSVLEGFKNTLVSCQVHNAAETCLRSLLKNLDKRHKHVPQTFVTMWRCKKPRSHLKS